METEGAEMLESLLPSKFKYRVKEVKILEQSEILEEVKFYGSFDVNIWPPLRIVSRSVAKF